MLLLRVLVYLFLLFVSFSSLQADTSIYGRLDLAISNIETIDKGSSTEIKSLASRVGFKGSQIFDNGLAVIYQYELEVDVVIDFGLVRGVAYYSDLIFDLMWQK